MQDILNELDFFLTDCAVGAVLNFVLIWLLAPTVAAKAGPGPFAAQLSKLPVGTGAAVYLFDLPLSLTLLRELGSASFYMTVSEGGQVVAAAAVNLVLRGGAVVEAIPVDRQTILPRQGA